MNPAPRGVTLIELLVVMAVIGLLISLATISLGDGNNPDRVLDRAIEQFYQQALLGRDQAVWSSQPLGLQLVPTQDDLEWELRWLGFQGGVWKAAEQMGAAVKIEAGLLPLLSVEGEMVTMEQLRSSAAAERPGIIFFPTGEVTPFELRFEFPAAGIGSAAIQGRSPGNAVFSSATLAGLQR